MRNPDCAQTGNREQTDRPSVRPSVDFESILFETIEGRDEIYRQAIQSGLLPKPEPAAERETRIKVHAWALKAKKRNDPEKGTASGLFTYFVTTNEKVSGTDYWKTAKEKIEYTQAAAKGKLLGPNQPKGNGKEANQKSR